jgi:D-sedoheptulose 7-phosphate isomerase
LRLAHKIPAMEEVIRRTFAESIRAKEQFLAEHETTLIRVARLMADTINQGHKILLLGNGGSAADAQHIAAEFVNRFLVERRPLPAIALTTDTSTLTSIGNDYSFEEIFSKQIEALGQAGDVAIAISTSGNSPNVLRAVDACGRVGLFVVGLTGGDGGALRDQVDFLLNVSQTRETARVQECHILAMHVLCDLVDRQLFPEGYTSGDAG